MFVKMSIRFALDTLALVIVVAAAIAVAFRPSACGSAAALPCISSSGGPCFSRCCPSAFAAKRRPAKSCTAPNPAPRPHRASGKRQSGPRSSRRRLVRGSAGVLAAALGLRSGADRWPATALDRRSGGGSAVRIESQRKEAAPKRKSKAFALLELPLAFINPWLSGAVTSSGALGIVFLPKLGPLSLPLKVLDG